MPRFLFLLPLLALILPTGARSYELFYLEKTGAQCVAYQMRIPQLTKIELFSGPQCPEQVLWASASELYFIRQGRLWKLLKTKQGHPRESELGVLPLTTADAVSPVILWQESGQGIRIAYLQSVPAGDAKSREYVFEGKKIPRQLFPAIGTPAMAIVAQWQDAAWKRLEATPSSAEAGEALGLLASKLYTQRKMQGLSLHELRQKGKCAGDVLNCDVTEENVKKVVGQAESYGRLALGQKHSLAFVVVWGDAPHAAGPVFWCEKNCENARALSLPSGMAQLALSASAQGDYFLLAAETGQQGVKVFSTQTAKELVHLPLAKEAVWLP